MNMKKSLAIALAFVMVFCTVTVPAFAGIETPPVHIGGGTGGSSKDVYLYTVEGDTATITGITPDAPSALVIPSMLEGKKVVAVADEAFREAEDLTRVIFPTTVQSLGVGLFENCIALNSVTLPNGLSQIPERAFSGCASLSEIVIPDSVTHIGSAAFAGTDIVEIELPDGMESISEGTFANCKRLKTVSLPKTVVTVGEGAFADCDALADVWYFGLEADKAGITVEGGNETAEPMGKLLLAADACHPG